MKCIILCAGYATRLHPLTLSLPKPLIEVGGRAILTHLIEKINEVNVIDEIIIISNNKFYDDFVEYAKSVPSNKKITVINDLTNSNEDRLGVVGDLKYALHLCNIDEEIMLLAGDNLFDYSLEEVVNYYQDNSSLVVCKKINEMSDLKRFGLVTLDGDKVTSFVEKPENPKTDIATFATYIFNKEIVSFVKNNNYDYFSKDLPLIHYLYKDFDLRAFLITGECYDIGTHESLNLVRKIYETK